jgi:hypothetical protein
MRTSSIPSDEMVSIQASQFAHMSLLDTLHRVLDSLYTQIDRIGTAIALGEANDLEGAQSLREKYAK